MESSERAVERVANAIYEALNRIDVLPELVAQRLSRMPGHIQFRIWKMLRHLIRLWAIDARYQQYDSQYVEMYRWAERMEKFDGA